MAQQRKRKLFLEWDSEKELWKVKKSVGFLTEGPSFTKDTLREFLLQNEDVDVTAKYY